MRATLLFAVFLTCISVSNAQTRSLNSLPAGTYETNIKNGQDKWDHCNIIILNDKNYKISTSDEIGEFRFSATAQRIFFTSGPLQRVYARTLISNNEPSIYLPVHENEHLGVKLPSEIWCSYKQ